MSGGCPLPYKYLSSAKLIKAKDLKNNHKNHNCKTIIQIFLENLTSRNSSDSLSEIYIKFNFNTVGGRHGVGSK